MVFDVFEKARTHCHHDGNQFVLYIYIWQFSKGRLSHAVQDSSLVQWICIYFQVHYNVCV